MTRMSSVCHSCVSICHPYIIPIFLYVLRMSLIRTRMLFVCHLYVILCHSYVARIYSYLLLISLACICMSLVCHSYVLVCHMYVLLPWTIVEMIFVTILQLDAFRFVNSKFLKVFWLKFFHFFNMKSFIVS